MKTLAGQYPRYGCQRIRIFMCGTGHDVGVHRAHRLWRQARLLLLQRRPRRRVSSARPRPLLPHHANCVWAYAFVFDATAEGRQIKCLTVIDEYTRECLAIDVAGSIRSRCVIDTMAKLVSVHGAPLFMRSDNGPQFVSRAILEWIEQSGIATALIDPDKPWQNGSNESFNGKFRDECLSAERFRPRAEAKTVIETWRHYCKAVPPQSSLNCLTPTEFKQQHQPTPNWAILQE